MLPIPDSPQDLPTLKVRLIRKQAKERAETIIRRIAAEDRPTDTLMLITIMHIVDIFGCAILDILAIMIKCIERHYTAWVLDNLRKKDEET